MKRLYSLCILLCMLTSVVQAGLSKPEHDKRSPVLAAPIYLFGTLNVDQTNIYFNVGHSNAGTVTLEIYRSTSQNGTYGLIFSTTDHAVAFVDPNLKPRTTFYYKFRAVSASETSPFSEVLGATTYSVNYEPLVEVTQVSPEDMIFDITDRSYNDFQYYISRVYGPQPNQTVQLDTWIAIDSGSVHQISDGSLTSGKTYTYIIEADIHGEGFPKITVKEFTVTPALYPPYFNTDEPWDYVCGAKNMIEFTNTNHGDKTDMELYRADAEDGPYHLIAAVDGQDYHFIDEAVTPRKTYYYKIRATNEYGVSEFSTPLQKVTGSNWYAPTLSYAFLNSNTLEVKFTDNSYADASYTITRNSEEGEVYLAQNYAMPDSGNTVSYVQGVTPGETYYFDVEARTEVYCDGYPYNDGVGHLEVTVPDGQPLSPPLVLEATLYIDQTDVRFGLENGNTRGITEVYRSTSIDTGYVLAETYTQIRQQFYFNDYDLGSRTTYYYRARVVDGTEISGWSEVVEATTYSNWYLPTMVATPFDGSSIDVMITDNSYNDVYYTVERQEEGSSIWEWLYEFSAADSGSVFSFTDSYLKPATKYTYAISVELQGEGAPSYYHVASVAATTLIDAPELEIDEEHYGECGAAVPLVASYPSLGANTEFYRSTAPGGPWMLVKTTIPSEGDVFTDHPAPRTTYYYRARGVKGSTVSGWSNVVSKAVGSNWYDPTFTATVLSDGTVDVKLVHNSFVTGSYGISRLENTSTGDFTFIASLTRSDSASVYTYHDTALLPGTSYTYFLTGNTVPLCDGWPGGDGDQNMDEQTIITPADDYTIAGFTLVDPVTDQDISTLSNNAYFEVTQLPNIRANVGPKVKSVIFFLNGKRRTDNGAPLFTYWPAQNGDYDPGVWTSPGTYILQATAYSEKNGGGIAGTQVTIVFQVKESVTVTGFTLVDPVTNQDIGPLNYNSVVDASLNANIRATVVGNAKSVTFFLNRKRRTDNGGPIFSYFPEKNGDYDGGLSVPGTYRLEATPATEKNGGGVIGFTKSIEFTVINSLNTSPVVSDDNANARSIALYPNPVTSDSRLMIRTLPASVVSVQLYDQFGNPIGQQIKGTVDAHGEYQLPLQALQLTKGAYILNVIIDGERTIKRFVVE